MSVVDQTEAMLTTLKVLTVALGFIIIVRGARAWYKTKQAPTLWLTMGIALLTLGAISEFMAYKGLGWSLDNAHITEGIVTLAGFIALVYSLYVK